MPCGCMGTFVMFWLQAQSSLRNCMYGVCGITILHVSMRLRQSDYTTMWVYDRENLRQWEFTAVEFTTVPQLLGFHTVCDICVLIRGM